MDAGVLFNGSLWLGGEDPVLTDENGFPPTGDWLIDNDDVRLTDASGEYLYE